MRKQFTETTNWQQSKYRHLMTQIEQQQQDKLKYQLSKIRWKTDAGKNWCLPVGMEISGL